MYIYSVELDRQAYTAINLSKKTLNISRKHLRATVFQFANMIIYLAHCSWRLLEQKDICQ